MTQHVPFPSGEDRAALRNQYLSRQKNPGNTNAMAQAVASRKVHPQTEGAAVKMLAEPLAPSPRVQRQAGTFAEPKQGPVVDPSLVAALEGNPIPTQAGPQAQRPVQWQQPRQVEEYAAPEANWHEPPRPRPVAADVGPSVQNMMPGYVLPIADSGGTSLYLHSRFAYYPFKDLYVVPFRNAHLAKLQRAQSEKSLQPVVEAVSTAIYSSDPQYKNLAFDLTVPDFYTVLYWLRFNSFTKMSFTHKDICRNPDHLEKVQKGELKEESLILRAIVDRTTLKTHDLEMIPDPEIYCLPEDAPFVISPPTMRDVIEFLDHPMMRSPNTRVEFAYLAQRASNLHSKGEYVSIEDRINWLEMESPDLGLMLKDFQTATSSYGVEEHTTMNCSVCGAKRKSNLVLDASTFLSRS